jgi:hypothetical protein
MGFEIVKAEVKRLLFSGLCRTVTSQNILFVVLAGVKIGL